MLQPAAHDLRRLSNLLDEALELPESEREAWLAALSGDALALAPTLRGLLARQAAGETGDLIDRMPAFTVVDDVSAAAAQFQAGDAVGPYRLQRELGRGGMGEVWLAERTDGQLKRAVALKLPMLGARRSLLVQRFARERDILGSLSHPHIARLYDAGLADDGQPYLALEYVQGQPIVAYCSDHALDARGRIGLLRQVMDAVQYAHANLVIHRDLKPSNVLVTPEGQAMLLDFGIAKLLADEQGQALETELTQLGGRAMTLHYAAPEQLAGAPISIATDVYALGVLLYELLAGHRPFQADTRAALEQAVLDVEPARPSQSRGGVIAKLPRSLASDLDTIVLKALKKAPAERYATVSALADDLDRLARGEAVLAQRDSRRYRLHKFVTRHRVPVLLGSTVAVALVALSTVALIQANEASRQSSAAQQEAKRAQTVQAFLIDLFQANSSEQADPQAARQATARDLLDRGAARVDEALRDDPQTRFEVLRTLADMYWQLDLQSEAAKLERRRMQLARQQYGPRDARLAKVLLDYAETIQESEFRDETPALVDEALAALDAAGESTSEVRGQALVIAADYWRHVSLQRALRAADGAIEFLQRHHPRSDRLVAAHMHAARMRIFKGEFDDAAAQAASSMAAANRLGVAAPTWLWQPTSTLAEVMMSALRLDHAEALLRAEVALATSVHGETHSRALTSKARLGNLLQEIGRSQEGDALHDAVREALRADSRIEDYQRQYIAGILGLRLLERGRPDELEPILRADIDEIQRTLPRSALWVVRQRLWAGVQSGLGRQREARDSLNAAQAQWQAYSTAAESAYFDGAFAVARAQLETAAGNPAAALAALEPWQPTALRVLLGHHVERARALLALQRHAEAEGAAELALRSLAGLPAGYRPVAVEADARLLRGQARLAQGHAGDAQVDLATALELRRRHDAPGSLWLADAQLALVACEVRLGRIESARTLLTQAQRSHAALGPAAGHRAAAIAEAQRLLAGRDARRATP